MAQFDAKTLAIVKRLQNARLSLLQKHPFYALLLMYMKFSIDLTCETAYTDGNRIASLIACLPPVDPPLK